MSTEHLPAVELTDREIRAELKTAAGDRKAALEAVRDQRRAWRREHPANLYGFR